MWRLGCAAIVSGARAKHNTTDYLSQGACSGGSGACIDPIFGPTAAPGYWSSTPLAGRLTFAWLVDFNNGFVGSGTHFRSDGLFARSVRVSS
jgi:hypothetical protein